MPSPNKSMQTSIFVLPDGPNTEPKYLSCASIDSVTVPLGSNTLHFCKDPNVAGKYNVIAKIKGPPGLVTFTVDQVVQAVKSYLIRHCPMAVIVNAFARGAPSDFTNWDQAWVYPGADVAQRTRSNFSNRGDANDLMMVGFDMEADEEIELLPLKPYRDGGVVETQAFNALFACAEDLCAGPEGSGSARCDTFYAVSDPVSGSASGTADVWKNHKGVWTASAADPFGADEVIGAGCCFRMDRKTTRILVFRGSTAANAPAEAAYSDDDGATWTQVNIGSTNDEYVPNAHSVFCLNRNNIWVGTSGGRIYFSGDGGVSWTVQEDAAIHSGAWNWIEFVDENVGFAGGAADVLATTVNGGTTWTQVTATGSGSVINCGAVLDANRLWVGTANGRLYYSNDAGDTWTRRSGWTGDGAGQVKAIRLFNDLVGYMAHNNATPKGTLLMTRDGGYTWEVIATPTNGGLNDLMLCDPNLLYAAGEPSGGTAVVYTVQPVA